MLGLGDVPPYQEPAETEPTFEGNALLKAHAALAATGLPSIADDSGICVDALNGMPGVLSARWSGPAKDNHANNLLLLGQLEDVPDERRGASFIAAVAFVRPDGAGRVGARRDARLGHPRPARHRRIRVRRAVPGRRVRPDHRRAVDRRERRDQPPGQGAARTRPDRRESVGRLEPCCSPDRTATESPTARSPRRTGGGPRPAWSRGGSTAPTPAGSRSTASAQVNPELIADNDADVVAADRRNAKDVRRRLRGNEDWPTFLIKFHLVEGPDPREELAAQSDAVPRGPRRPARPGWPSFDELSHHGPWTADTLRLIQAKPATRAADLAATLGRETAPFKLDVRKLKNLGLTYSLETGYELTPRGTAYLTTLDD